MDSVSLCEPPPPSTGWAAREQGIPPQTVFVLLVMRLWAHLACFHWSCFEYLQVKSGHSPQRWQILNVEFSFQNSAVFIEMLVSLKKNEWIILYEQWIWGHQTSGLLPHLWQPEQVLQARTRTFLDPIKVFSFCRPNQTVSTVLSQQHFLKLNQKKCKHGCTRFLSMRLTGTHLHIDDQVSL